MTVTVNQLLAICRVYVPGTQTRGTGFLIEDRNEQLCVLTAAHVVESAQGSKAKYAGADIELQFGPDRTLVSGVSVRSFASGADAAILSIPNPAALPPGSQPFRLRAGARGYRIRWATHGYSDHSEKTGPQGQAYDGTITTSDPNRYQLKVEQVQGSPSGLSGSPVIVGDQVVGIILKTQDQSSSETVFARCVTVLAVELTELLLAKIPMAYVGEVTYSLRDFQDLLAQTAVALKLGQDRNEIRNKIPDSDLPERVAETMLGNADSALIGVKDLRNYLRDKVRPGDSTTPPEVAARIVDFSIKTWIDADAVRMLAEVLKRGSRIVILNTRESEVASWYVHRAGCVARNHPGIFENAFPLDVQSIDRESLLADFEGALRAKFGTEFADSLETEIDHDSEPVVVWLTQVPAPEDLDYVRKKQPIYEKIRFILLAGGEIPPRVAAAFPNADIIEPRLVDDEVKRALEAHSRAKTKLMQLFNPKPKPASTSP